MHGSIITPFVSAAEGTYRHFRLGQVFIEKAKEMPD
jgi:hypothetical protein